MSGGADSYVLALLRAHGHLNTGYSCGIIPMKKGEVEVGSGTTRRNKHADHTTQLGIHISDFEE